MLPQDYNREVLTGLTMPNYEANVGKGGCAEDPPRFFSGGWASLKGLLRREGLAGGYDFVFTSDTIYSLDSQQPLLNCIAEVSPLQLLITPERFAFIILPLSISAIPIEVALPGGDVTRLVGLGRGRGGRSFCRMSWCWHPRKVSELTWQVPSRRAGKDCSLKHTGYMRMNSSHMLCSV